MAAMYSRGGATSGDYTVAVAGATSGNMGANAEFVVTPGNLFTVFTITQKEILASQSKQGAYVKALINRMFAATEGSRKLLAASLFGWGYGDVGTLPTAVAAAASSMTLNWDAVVKLDVGMTFFVVNGSSLTYPGGAAFYDTTARTISQINMQTVTWTGGGVTAGGWAAGILDTHQWRPGQYVGRWKPEYAYRPSSLAPLVCAAWWTVGFSDMGLPVGYFILWSQPLNFPGSTCGLVLPATSRADLLRCPSYGCEDGETWRRGT